MISRRAPENSINIVDVKCKITVKERLAKSAQVQLVFLEIEINNENAWSIIVSRILTKSVSKSKEILK